MIKVKLLRKEGQYNRGDVVEMCRNDAHALIDGGVAKVFDEYENKMMRTKKRKFKRKAKRTYLSKGVNI